MMQYENSLVRQTKTRVIIALKEVCEQAGISIPFPIHTLYYYNHQDDDGLMDSADGKVPQNSRYASDD